VVGSRSAFGGRNLLRGVRRNSTKASVAESSGSENVPTTITFQQGAKAASTGGIYIGIAALVGVCGFYIAKELMPTSMSPNTVFNNAFESVKLNPEVTSRLGDNIKAYGGDYNRRKEGRRNFVENDVYKDLDGVKRIRVKFNMEGSRGKAVVYAEVSEKMEKGEFAYIILEQNHHGRNEAIALVDNRVVFTKGEIQDKVVDRLNQAGAVLYGHSSCQWTHRQLAEFGEYADRLKSVMCDKDENKDACEKAKLPGYPCWVIRGEQLPSYHPLDQLQAICQQL